ERCTAAWIRIASNVDAVAAGRGESQRRGEHELSDEETVREDRYTVAHVRVGLSNSRSRVKSKSTQTVHEFVMYVVSAGQRATTHRDQGVMMPKTFTPAPRATSMTSTVSP